MKRVDSIIGATGVASVALVACFGILYTNDQYGITHGSVENWREVARRTMLVIDTYEQEFGQLPDSVDASGRSWRLSVVSALRNANRMPSEAVGVEGSSYQETWATVLGVMGEERELVPVRADSRDIAFVLLALDGGSWGDAHPCDRRSASKQEIANYIRRSTVYGRVIAGARDGSAVSLTVDEAIEAMRPQ